MDTLQLPYNKIVIKIGNTLKGFAIIVVLYGNEHKLLGLIYV